MKKRLSILIATLLGLASCTKSRYATVGPYESDDAYYTSADTYISDFALVDDEAQMAGDSARANGTSDDYYDPSYVSPYSNSSGSYAADSYANNWYVSPWNTGYYGCGTYGGSGFSSYQYGSYWSYSPYGMMSMGFSPFNGYYSNYHFGYNTYCNPYYNSYYGYNPYNSWYTPYYSPNYYSGWAYSPWYTPFNYYSAGGNNDNNSGTSIVHGPRTSLSAFSANNSTYSNGLFYNGSKRDGQHHFTPQEVAAKPMTSGTSTAPATHPSKPSFERPVSTSKPTKPSPVYSPSKPTHDRTTAKPRVSDSRTTPSRNNQIKPSAPQRDTHRDTSPGTAKPHREYTTPAHHEVPSHSRPVTPSHDAPRSSPRTESPVRSSGGSTHSPHRK
jgi:hypothetical protein